MHFSAKRDIAIACRLSVRLSVRPSVRPSAIDMAQNRPHWTLSMFGAMHSV